MFMLNLRII